MQGCTTMGTLARKMLWPCGLQTSQFVQECQRRWWRRSSLAAFLGRSLKAVLMPALVVCMGMEQRMKASNSSQSLRGSWRGSTWRRQFPDHNGVAPAGLEPSLTEDRRPVGLGKWPGSPLWWRPSSSSWGSSSPGLPGKLPR